MTPTREQVVQWLEKAGMSFFPNCKGDVIGDFDEVVSLIDAARADLEATIAEQEAEIERLQEHAMFLSQYNEPDDLEFELIERAAGESYRRYKSQVRGTTVTRSDGYEAHLIWATKARVETQLRQQLAAEQAYAEQLQTWIEKWCKFDSLNMDLQEWFRFSAEYKALSSQHDTSALRNHDQHVITEFMERSGKWLVNDEMLREYGAKLVERVFAYWFSNEEGTGDAAAIIDKIRKGEF